MTATNIYNQIENASEQLGEDMEVINYNFRIKTADKKMDNEMVKDTIMNATKLLSELYCLILISEKEGIEL